MSDFNQYEDDEDPFLYDEDALEDYNRNYMAGIENETRGLPEGEKEVFLEELNTKFNRRRTTSGREDARHNALETRASLDAVSRDPNVAKYLNYVDKRDGKGKGAALLQRAKKAELPLWLQGKIT
jgi:hypothetical protein